MDLHDLRDMPFGPLITRLTDQISRLLRQEFALIRTDVLTTGRRLAKGAAFIAIGAAVALFAAVALTFAAVAGLAVVMPLWGAALVIAAVYTMAALICIKLGIRSLEQISRSRNPLASLEEDLRWVKMRAKSAKK